MNKTQLLGACALFTVLISPVFASTLPLPVVNEGSKLGECIQYGKWVTTGPTKVYAKLGDRHTLLATVPAKATVTGLESRLLTTAPGSVRLPSDRPGYDADHNEVAQFKKGQTVSVVYYEGEGYYQVAHNGKLVDVELTDLQAGSSDLKGTNPKVEWWAKVRTKAGQVGWVMMDEAPAVKGTNKCANGGHPD